MVRKTQSEAVVPKGVPRLSFESVQRRYCNFFWYLYFIYKGEKTASQTLEIKVDLQPPSAWVSVSTWPGRRAHYLNGGECSLQGWVGSGALALVFMSACWDELVCVQWSRLSILPSFNQTNPHKPDKWLRKIPSLRKSIGTCLMVQWLRLCLLMQEVWVQFLVRVLRSYIMLLLFSH